MKALACVWLCSSRDERAQMGLVKGEAVDARSTETNVVGLSTFTRIDPSLCVCQAHPTEPCSSPTHTSLCLFMQREPFVVRPHRRRPAHSTEPQNTVDPKFHARQNWPGRSVSTFCRVEGKTCPILRLAIRAESDVLTPTGHLGAGFHICFSCQRSRAPPVHLPHCSAWYHARVQRVPGMGAKTSDRTCYQSDVSGLCKSIFRRSTRTQTTRQRQARSAMSKTKQIMVSFNPSLKAINIVFRTSNSACVFVMMSALFQRSPSVWDLALNRQPPSFTA